MVRLHRSGIRRAHGAALLALLLVGLIAGAGSRRVAAHTEHGMPARLQQGSCDAIGPVVYELIGVGGSEDLSGAPLPAPEIMGAPSAVAVSASVTTIGTTLEAIVSGAHALIVYLSDEAMDTPVACGDVGGIVLGTDLVVGLAAVGEEGQNGVAILHPDGQQTVITLVLTAHHDDHHGEGEETDATPAA